MLLPSFLLIFLSSSPSSVLPLPPQIRPLWLARRLVNESLLASGPQCRFRSGDLLRWDSDGRVYFHDRIGDTFRWKSENVSTTEVAQVLGLHPAVQEVNVYGVQLPNHDGRAGCAAVVLDSPPPPPSQQQQQQQQQKQKVSAELLTSLAAHARARLPRYAVPLFVRLLREVGMQTTGTYKQQKHVLRQQGVDPSSVGDDALFWLKDGVTYVPFTKTDWKALQAGVVKL